MLYQGIAARAFERRFQLADHVVVTGAASENGLLHVDLVREVPEAQKPRTIAINKGGARPSKPSKRLPPRLRKPEPRQRRENEGVPVGAPFFVYSNNAGGTMLTFGLSLASVDGP